MTNLSDHSQPPYNNNTINYNNECQNESDIDLFTNLQSITDGLAFKQLFSFLKLISTTIC